MVAAMYKAVFQNSKVALIFALVTILSAVSMVGTSEEGGMLTRVVSLVSNSRTGSAGEVQPQGPAGAVAASKPSVFGEYSPAASSGTAGNGTSQKLAQPAPTSQPLPPPPAEADIIARSGAVSDGVAIPEREGGNLPALPPN